MSMGKPSQRVRIALREARLTTKNKVYKFVINNVTVKLYFALIKSLVQRLIGELVSRHFLPEDRNCPWHVVEQIREKPRLDAVDE